MSGFTTTTTLAVLINKRPINRIKRKKKPLLIGLAYSFQRVKSIPFNSYDKKLDFVVTEKKIIE